MVSGALEACLQNRLPGSLSFLLVLQSGTFSGLNLAMFGITSLRLKAMAITGNEKAEKLLGMREDANFLLTTILWGNVGTNVLLTLASDSVMAGAAGFIFSTFVITFGGEIVPQAYFSRNALRMASLLAPLLRFYQILLYPLAKPSAIFLDAWLGKEAMEYLKEDELRNVLKVHAWGFSSEISRVEGLGAVNFMELDDLQLTDEGAPLHPDSVIELPFQRDVPELPDFEADKDDPFIAAIRASNQRWVFLAPHGLPPILALDASAFLRTLLIRGESPDFMAYCHSPVLVQNSTAKLSHVLGRWKFDHANDRIKHDLILLWGEERRVITGDDLLGFLMRDIAR